MGTLSSRECVLRHALFCIHATAADAQDAWLSQPHTALHHIEHDTPVLHLRGPRGTAIVDGGTFGSIEQHLGKQDDFPVHTHYDAYQRLLSNLAVSD